MGIVVTLCMLLGIGLLAKRELFSSNFSRSAIDTMAYIILAAGIWNTFWHGLRHMTEFWGVMAIVSGLCLMATSLIVLQSRAPNPLKNLAEQLVRMKPWVLAGLSVCFCMYLLALIRLNM